MTMNTAPAVEHLGSDNLSHTNTVSATPATFTGRSDAADVLVPNELLSFGAKQIVSLFVPVTICMFFVVLVASNIDYYASTDQYLIYTPFHTPDADLGTRTWQTLANTLIFMSIVVVMTIFLVLLFKFRCYKCIHAWLVAVTFILLFMISFQFFTQLFRTLDIFVDYITMAFVLWNFGVVGMIVIHWRGPLMLQQAYLIFLSAQIALMFLKYVPRWTCWVVLGALAIWDLIAVLCPRGPLRMLVEMAHERDQPLFPALLYSTTTAYLVAEPTESEHANTLNPIPTHGEYSLNDTIAPTSEPVTSEESMDAGVPLLPHTEQCNINAQPVAQSGANHPLTNGAGRSTLESHGTDPTPQAASSSVNLWREIQTDLREREERGVKLGLGDFVFYSLLIGRATLDGDSITVATTYIAILIGMCVTIIALGITRRALPALPISIACGILFYFVTSVMISPFLELIACHRMFF